MDILALDLGTSTGFCYNRGDELFCGTWKLGTDKEIKQWGKERRTRTKDPRIERLCEHITRLGKFDLVAFEDVEFSTYTKQTQLWSSFRASLWLCSDTTRTDCVPVGTLKKFATGSGAADKPAMALHLKLRHPRLWNPGLDENAIDATWVWLWAKETFKRLNK